MVLGVIHGSVSDARVIYEEFLLDGETVPGETGSDMSHHNKMNRGKGKDKKCGNISIYRIINGRVGPRRIIV